MKFRVLVILICIFGSASVPHHVVFGKDQSIVQNTDSLGIDTRPYIRYPKIKQQWGLQVGTGLTLTKLPTEVVEEEINQSPMINAICRFDTPSRFWAYAQLKTNYIANYFVLGANYTVIDDKWSVALGNDLAIWFGHVEFGDFSLKARGLITYPNISIGIDFDDFFLTLKSEIQYSVTLTDVDGAYFGYTRENKPGYGFTFSIEQPFWNDNWVIVGAKVNYATFYYQAWLSYSTLDEYLLFPELIFTFII